MNTSPSRLFGWIASLGVGVACAAPACAALGGDVASVAADAELAHGVVTTTPLQQYDVREIDSANSMQVREFVNRAGMVFAVSWSGPFMPDLKQLLGASFPAYSAGLQAGHAGLRRAVRVTAADVVVEYGGHLRAYSGHAYLLGALPAGMSPAALR